jgi:TPR repeat protein
MTQRGGLFATLVLVFCLVLSGLGERAFPSPEEFRKGLMAYHRGDLEQAFTIWQDLAKKGSASAQYSLGFMYYNGDGRLPDHRQAAKWFRRAADQGDPDAQLSLGLLYAQGEGVTRDYAKAYRWFALAYRHFPPGNGRDSAYRNMLNAASLLPAEDVERLDKSVATWHPKSR